jgi:hypothetical protein
MHHDRTQSPRSSARFTLPLAALIASVGTCLGFGALPAFAQAQSPATKTPTNPVKAPKPVAPQPEATDQPAMPRAQPKDGPYLTLTNRRDMTLSVRVRLLRGNSITQIDDLLNGTSAVVEKTEAFDRMDTVAMIWPVLSRTATASYDASQLRGTLTFDDTQIAQTHKMMNNYQGGVQYARFDAPPVQDGYTPRKVELSLTIPVSVSRTVFDEAGALRVPRPGAYPANVAAWLKPQLFVEQAFDPQTRAIMAYEPKAIEVAVEQAARGAGVRDFANQGAVATAKAMTHYVWGAMQLTSAGATNRQRYGEVPPARLSRDRAFSPNDFGGVVIQPPVRVLESKRGTQYDAAALLTAMIRHAGIPARPVIGYDPGGSGSSGLKDGLNTRGSREGRGIRVWVEFALYDQQNHTLSWVPIDIAKILKSSSRPQPLTKEWRYFGTHDELNGVVPFAHHFFPPTDVVSYGAPAFWGWFVTPKAPDNAGQSIIISAAAASKRSEDMPGRNGEGRDRKKDDDDDDRKKGLK